MRHTHLAGEHCAIARSVAILGERWTFVILRQAFMGARRFEDYQRGTSIARNILTDRLKALVEAEILERRPYASHTKRTLHEYRLTQKGIDLYPILVTMMEWGNKYGGFEGGPPIDLVHQTCGKVTQPHLVCSECGEEIDAREMRPQLGAPEAAPA